MTWVDQLRAEGWADFLAFLDRLRRQALEDEHRAKTWEEVLKARGRVEQMDTIVHIVTMEEREARDLHDYRQRTTA